MFNVELIEIVLKNKKEELQDIQTNQPTNTIDIDNLNKEIKYLNSIIIRYKIAKLLKLDTNKEYMDINFFGIEEENVDDFNLSQGERDEYNNLIGQLPPEQLGRYKIRRQLAKIVGESNIDDIEKVNPNLTKYNLTPEQIKDFTDLVTKLNSMADDTTKIVEIDAVKLLKDTFDKLNIEDIDEYNKIKNTYLDTLDKIMKSVDKENQESLFSDVSNCEFASDITKKYPELKVKLNLKGIESLLVLINTTDLSDDEYNEKIEILIDNITELAKDDTNKQKIVDLINNTNINKYSLRYDLKNKLDLEEVKLDVKDDELESIITFLDNNYDKLNEKERDNCYNLIKDKINEDVRDISKVENINDILLTITNRELVQKLQKDFSSVDTLKFNNQHFNSYQLLLNQEVEKLKRKKSNYESKKNKSGPLSSYYDVKINEIEKAMDNLSSIQNDHSNNGLVTDLDLQYNEKTDKIIELRKEIEDLKKLKEDIKLKFYQKILDKRISRREKKISKLKQSKVKIVGMQKKIMVPKLWLSSKKGTLDRHFEAKTEVYQNYSDDYKKVADAERSMNFMFSGIKSIFYEHKANKFQSKADFNQKICDKLANSKVNVNGSNQQKISKNLLDRIRQLQQQKLKTQTII